MSTIDTVENCLTLLHNQRSLNLQIYPNIYWIAKVTGTLLSSQAYHNFFNLLHISKSPRNAQVYGGSIRDIPKYFFFLWRDCLIARSMSSLTRSAINITRTFSCRNQYNIIAPYINASLKLVDLHESLRSWKASSLNRCPSGQGFSWAFQAK